MSKQPAPQYEGGYVKEPEAGIHENILVFDFKSLLPSIIITHNISPETLNCPHEECKKNSVPGFERWFCLKEKGKIPETVEKAIKDREKVKELLKNKKLSKDERTKLEKKEQQLKLVANISYGKFGYSKSSHFNIQCAEAIASFGRFYVKKAIEAAEKTGFHVIYSDTDSIFIKDQKKEGEKFLSDFNKSLPGTIKLEFRGKFEKGLFVTKKTGQGAKKRYALIDKKENIIIKGFAAIRGDWCGLAKKTQKEIIKLVLENKKDAAVKFAKDMIKKIESKKMKLSDLIISEQLTKHIEEYANVGPHVAVAKKLKEKGIETRPGEFVEYIVTSRPGKISEKAEPAGSVKIEEVDTKYYIGHQLVPVAMEVLGVLEVKEEDILGMNLKAFEKK